MTCEQNQIVDHSPDSSALDRAVTDGHIIVFHRCCSNDAKNVVSDHREFQNHFCVFRNDLIAFRNIFIPELIVIVAQLNAVRNIIVVTVFRNLSQTGNGDIECFAGADSDCASGATR